MKAIEGVGGNSAETGTCVCGGEGGEGEGLCDVPTALSQAAAHPSQGPSWQRPALPREKSRAESGWRWRMVRKRHPMDSSSGVTQSVSCSSSSSRMGAAAISPQVCMRSNQHGRVGGRAGGEQMERARASSVGMSNSVCISCATRSGSAVARSICQGRSSMCEHAVLGGCTWRAGGGRGC